MGATSSDILTLVVQRGLPMVGLGLTIGIIAALAGSRFIESMFFGVRGNGCCYARDSSFSALSHGSGCVPTARSGRSGHCPPGVSLNVLLDAPLQGEQTNRARPWRRRFREDQRRRCWMKMPSGLSGGQYAQLKLTS